jgi:hypothetical protein
VNQAIEIGSGGEPEHVVPSPSECAVRTVDVAQR